MIRLGDPGTGIYVDARCSGDLMAFQTPFCHAFMTREQLLSAIYLLGRDQSGSMRLNGDIIFRSSKKRPEWELCLPDPKRGGYFIVGFELVTLKLLAREFL